MSKIENAEKKLRDDIKLFVEASNSPDGKADKFERDVFTALDKIANQLAFITDTNPSDWQTDRNGITFMLPTETADAEDILRELKVSNIPHTERSVASQGAAVRLNLSAVSQTGFLESLRNAAITKHMDQARAAGQIEGVESGKALNAKFTQEVESTLPAGKIR